MEGAVTKLSAISTLELVESGVTDESYQDTDQSFLRWIVGSRTTWDT